MGVCVAFIVGGGIYIGDCLSDPYQLQLELDSVQVNAVLKVYGLMQCLVIDSGDRYSRALQCK